METMRRRTFIKALAAAAAIPVMAHLPPDVMAEEIPEEIPRPLDIEPGDVWMNNGAEMIYIGNMSTLRRIPVFPFYVENSVDCTEVIGLPYTSRIRTEIELTSDIRGLIAMQDAMYCRKTVQIFTMIFGKTMDLGYHKVMEISDYDLNAKQGLMTLLLFDAAKTSEFSLS